MKVYKSLFLVVPVLIFLISCDMPRGPYSPISREDDMTPHQMTHGVTMLDLNVRNSFLLINHTAKKTPGGQIIAKISLQNVFNNEDLWADVMFTFYDVENQPVDKSVWRSVHFPPQELVLVEGSSMSSNVERFNAQFKNLKTRSGKTLTYPGRVYEHGQWKQGVLPR